MYFMSAGIAIVFTTWVLYTFHPLYFTIDLQGLYKTSTGIGITPKLALPWPSLLGLIGISQTLALGCVLCWA